MKKLLLAVVIAGAGFTMAPTDAFAWQCRASSASGGWGVGWHPNRARAARIALNYCAANTPRGVWCRIRYCA
ncbi:hypothetical protein GJW-30_1_02206 [Variibacter gotjawalensis]|jgi:hypothetical protein|uniref:DUF4189 domain-containing protein n=1 Tax=Variibacter gotjawalensis TaxID=1333996 RepID=A0A0S3PUQ1_9BRAD|nr:hypothetical protein [Variibacter gotjawalensis]NIK49999.1 hypothetical protein [Variibacter gotjawalensis]RZS45998.1 hypothetical protein EV661_4324 [Variibacter gotjawalensis]BAT59673.1 hypothetical protein GJW-30_1_02206 [Variibacter gotjawalensis]